MLNERPTAVRVVWMMRQRQAYVVAALKGGLTDEQENELAELTARQRAKFGPVMFAAMESQHVQAVARFMATDDEDWMIDHACHGFASHVMRTSSDATDADRHRWWKWFLAEIESAIASTRESHADAKSHG